MSITRAKQGLIIVGDAGVLISDLNWGKLLDSYAKRGVLVEDETQDNEDGEFKLVEKYLDSFGCKKRDTNNTKVSCFNNRYEVVPGRGD